MKTMNPQWAATFCLALVMAISGCGGGGSDAPPSPVGPVDVYTVNTTDDLVDDNSDDGICHTVANSCSLRAAIMQANHRVGAGLTTRIELPGGIYTLTRPINGANGEDNGDLNLTTPNSVNQRILIAGAGAANTVIDGNRLDGVIDIAAGRDVRISGVTIRNGGRQPGSFGGGILNRGTLEVSECTVEGNDGAAKGGGIYNAGVLIVVRSTIESNSAETEGGGIFSSGSLIVRVSTIRLNALRSNFSSQGGGMYVSGATNVRDSTVYGNAAVVGGGILNAGQMSVVNSTISGNTATIDGGGVYNFGTTALYSTSVVGNNSDHDGNASGVGGGVYSPDSAPGKLQVTNTLIANNTVGKGSIANDCVGNIVGYGWNLLGKLAGCDFNKSGGNGDPSRGLIAPSSIGALAGNGGPTFTHALAADAAAVDSTTAQGCIDETGVPLTTDQRGAPRVAGPRCDVGAFEYGAVVP